MCQVLDECIYPIYTLIQTHLLPIEVDEEERQRCRDTDSNEKDLYSIDSLLFHQDIMRHPRIELGS